MQWGWGQEGWGGFWRARGAIVWGPGVDMVTSGFAIAGARPQQHALQRPATQPTSESSLLLPWSAAAAASLDAASLAAASLAAPALAPAGARGAAN